MTAAVAQRVVTAGFALLEQKIPGFWREDHHPAIDLTALHQGDCAACVVGQLYAVAGVSSSYDVQYACYAAALAALGVGADDQPRYGFDDSDDVSHGELTAEFRRQITARRADARATAGTAS